jgi:hypothetical protein
MEMTGKNHFAIRGGDCSHLQQVYIKERMVFEFPIGMQYSVSKEFNVKY